MPNTDSQLKTVGWDDINWQQAERYVFKLQKRIYEASRHGDVKKVRQLQRTLIRSWSNKVLAIRRVTQDNRGKKTAGVDGIKCLFPEARTKLLGQLKLTGKSKPTRRVWIPKPGKDEKRPLGIPTIYDRALQALVKNAIEPEWEADFEASSYGFRPGRSCHDAIKQIKISILSKPKFVLDADITKCFDKINHQKLLEKTGYKGKIRQQIKSWLKSGVVDQRNFLTTDEGTPQGGVISPLLANIALHGMEIALKRYAESLTIWDNKGNKLSRTRRRQSLTFIRYADDFLLIHKDLEVIQKGKEIISQWLRGIGLELKPSKTRITHTLLPEYSEDGIAGFDFLGHHIQQFPVGKYKSANHPSTGEKLGFRTLIRPSKQACQRHQEKIKSVIKKHKHSSQFQLINELNPIIRGWSNYFSNSDAQTVGELKRQDYLIYQKLRAWGRYRCGSSKKAYRKYWHKIKTRVTFCCTEGKNFFKLINHSEIGSSSNQYTKVKGTVSPFDGDLIYWSSRMGRHPEMPLNKAKLLKSQKGICNWCKLYFREGDILEKDHITPTALGGKNEWNNLQLLHGHCHDEKTHLDMIKIQNYKFDKYLTTISKELANRDWFWDENDILIV